MDAWTRAFADAVKLSEEGENEEKKSLSQQTVGSSQIKTISKTYIENLSGDKIEEDEEEFGAFKQPKQLALFMASQRLNIDFRASSNSLGNASVTSTKKEEPHNHSTEKGITKENKASLTSVSSVLRPIATPNSPTVKSSRGRMKNTLNPLFRWKFRYRRSWLHTKYIRQYKI